MIDIRAALIAGHAAMREKHAKRESRVAANPRVGSVGCVADDGEVYGVCPRIALARQLGIEAPPELKTQIMWKAGEANETTWHALMDIGATAHVALGGQYISAKVEGVPLPVLGHPDAVFAHVATDDTPEFGVELKGIFGASTAVSVALQNRPKNENLIQAAAYSHFMGKLPWALHYTSAGYVGLNKWDEREYGVKTIEPFYKTFYLEWQGDRLAYRSDESALVPTVITGKGIEDYYRLVEEMRTSKDLGPRPSSHYVCGAKNKWGRESQCGLCPFKAACARYDTDRDYDNWLTNIRVTTGVAA